MRAPGVTNVKPFPTHALTVNGGPHKGALACLDSVLNSAGGVCVSGKPVGDHIEVVSDSETER